MVPGKTPDSTHKSSGMFLFFLTGLFLLQVIFAFTIHGDIGPQAALNTSCRTPASPVLMGRIDTILSAPNQSEPAPRHPSPKALEARSQAVRVPQTQGETAAMVSPRAMADQSALEQKASLKNRDSRYFEYTVSRGDTLEGISRKLSGNTGMVGALVRLNRLSNEKGLQCGSHLLIPRTLMARK